MSNTNTLFVQAAEDFTGKDHVFVQLDSDNNIILCPTGEVAVGILQDTSPKIGELGVVINDGNCKVRLGGTVVVGDFLTVGANGKAVVMIATDNYVGAQALEAGVSGDLIDCKFIGAIQDNLATGNVVGPGSATDNAIARFDLTTGKIIQNSPYAILDDTGNLTLGDGPAASFSPAGYGGVVQSYETDDALHSVIAEGSVATVELATSVFAGADPGAFVGTVSNHYLNFYTNNASRFHMYENGENLFGLNVWNGNPAPISPIDSVLGILVNSGDSQDALKIIDENLTVVTSINKSGVLDTTTVLVGAGGVYTDTIRTDVAGGDEASIAVRLRQLFNNSQTVALDWSEPGEIDASTSSLIVGQLDANGNILNTSGGAADIGEQGTPFTTAHATSVCATSIKTSADPAVTVLDVTNRTLKDSTGAGSIYFESRELSDSGDNIVLDWSGPGVLNMTGASTRVSIQYETPLTGVTVTLGAAVTNLIVNPAGTIAALTITLPAAADGKIFTVSSSEIITALTLTPNGGNTIKNDVTTMIAGQAFTFVARSGVWYRG